MLTALVRLKRRRRRPSRIIAVKPIERSKTISERAKHATAWKKEYLKNRNLSIMTDMEPDLIVKNDRRACKKKSNSVYDSKLTLTSNLNHPESCATTKENNSMKPISNWENVHSVDFSNSIQSNSVPQKYCSPKPSRAWYFKFRREVLKNLRNKVYPVITSGNKKRNMAQFEKLDEKHPYYVIAAARMWQKPETKQVTAARIYWKFAAFNFIHKRIQETDGGFFENLGSLLAERRRAQEDAEGPLPKNREEILAQEEEEDNQSEKESIDEPTDALLETDSDRDEEEHARNLLLESMGWNIDQLYHDLVYMIQHQIGYDISNECGKEAMLNHLQSAFKVDSETHERVYNETSEMEPPEMRLNIEVIEAKELASKDANGKSDPFCILYLESAPTKRYNTAVKTSTLSPLWEEHFELPLDDSENGVLCLEVWDFDPAETVPEKMNKVKEIKGVRGFVKLAKEIAVTATTGNHDNEFIGRCRIPLKDIPTTGCTMWYALEKKNKSKRRGLIKLRLAFSAHHNTQVAAQEYSHLIRVLLMHEIETEKIEKYCWCGRWSAPAEALLLQHSTQRGILTRNVTLYQWIEYARIHQEHPLNFTVFHKLAVDLVRPMEIGLFSPEEIRPFWDATKRILYSCLNCVRKISRFTVNDKNATSQVSAILGTLLPISFITVPEDVDLFPAKMYSWFPDLDDTKPDVYRALEYAVEKGGAEWFEYIVSNNSPESESDEHALKYHIKVIQLIRADLQRASDNYNAYFIKRMNFPYVRILYMAYEKRISDMCMIIIEDVCGRLKRIEVDTEDVELSLGVTLFELYLALQRFAGLGQVLCDEEQLEYMKVQEYHEWFKAGVAHWLDIAVCKALKRIDRALEFDTLQAVDNTLQFSSSAVDTLSIFYQIKVFWTQLAWPDVEGSYTFIAKIIDDICKCSIAYADKMAMKAELTTELEQLSESSSVYEKKFFVSTAWCFAINNINYIRTSLEPFANDLGLETIVNNIAENKTEAEAERCRQTLQLIVDNANDTVKNKIIELLQVVAGKMAPAMSRYLMEGAELIDTTSNAMDRLLQYLDTNLTILKDNLNKDNFERVLLVIWEIMAETLYQLVRDNLEKRRPPAYYSNLNRTLHTLIRFFNLGADETANVQILEKIEHLLKLHGLETAILIHRYNQERVQEQNELEESLYGLITVKAQFVDNSLNIQILNGRNLRPSDSNADACRREYADRVRQRGMTFSSDFVGDFIGKLSTLERKLHSISKQRLREGKSSKCDTYVKVRLLPEEKFADLKLPKTHVQKETLFPLFDETFNIPLSKEQRSTEDAIVAFELKDKDFLRSRFLAEAFLPFNEIPKTGPEEGMDSLEQIHLKLSRPTKTGTDILRALEHRKGDNQAMDFISRLNVKSNSK